MFQNKFKPGKLIGFMMGKCSDLHKKKAHKNHLRKLREALQGYSTMWKETGHSITSDTERAQRDSGSGFMIAEIDWVEELSEGDDLDHASVCPTWEKSKTWIHNQWKEKKKLHGADSDKIKQSRLIVCGWRHCVFLDAGPSNQKWKYWARNAQPCQRSFCYLSAKGLKKVKRLAEQLMHGHQNDQRLRRECFQGDFQKQKIVSSAMMDLRANTKMDQGEELVDRVATNMTVVLTQRLRDVPNARETGKTGDCLSTEKRVPEKKETKSARAKKETKSAKKGTKSAKAKKKKNNSRRRRKSWRPHCPQCTCQQAMVFVAFQQESRWCDVCDRDLNAGEAWECKSRRRHESFDTSDLCPECADKQRLSSPPPLIP